MGDRARRTGIYTRASQDRVGAGLAVERQEEDCRPLADRLGWTVAEVYTDNDVSAYSGKRRPGYERMLADIESGRIDAVIAWHGDRLHRSPVELERYIAVCDPRGVPTHTVRAGELDLSTANGRMMARITGAVARHESEQKSERLRRQRQQVQADGRWHGGRRPFGFEPDGLGLRPEEAMAIQDATRRILGGESLRSIYRQWNDQGMTTSTGQPWVATQFRQMLLRPRNAGMVGNRHRQPLGDAVWPAIVNREQWEALRALLNDPARRTHTGTSRVLVGSFLYRCECGQLMHSGGVSNGHRRYFCPDGHRRKAQPVDDLVFDVICAVLVRDNVSLIAPAADVQPLRDHLQVLRAHAEEIASMFGDPTSGMTADQFRTANQRVQLQIQEAEAEVGRMSTGSALAGIADAPDPRAAFLGAGVDVQRAVIGALAEVTLKRLGRGRLPGGLYFHPSTVTITPRYGVEPGA